MKTESGKRKKKKIREGPCQLRNLHVDPWKFMVGHEHGW